MQVEQHAKVVVSREGDLVRDRDELVGKGLSRRGRRFQARRFSSLPPLGLRWKLLPADRLQQPGPWPCQAGPGSHARRPRPVSRRLCCFYACSAVQPRLLRLAVGDGLLCVSLDTIEVADDACLSLRPVDAVNSAGRRWLSLASLQASPATHYGLPKSAGKAYGLFSCFLRGKRHILEINL
jgi:hypothetical protein